MKVGKGVFQPRFEGEFDPMGLLSLLTVHGCIKRYGAGLLPTVGTAQPGLELQPERVINRERIT